MMVMRLDPNWPQQPFPTLHHALKTPNGLLAVGGCLSLERLLNAYQHGIFPWFAEGEPILWWSPDPRLVLFPEKMHVSRRLRKKIRQGRFSVTFDRAFDEVIAYCAAVRETHGEGTWLHADMRAAYRQLHHQGYAHSVECWYQDQLVGGLYGVALGRVFFGESMFHRVSDASKIALVGLVEQLSAWGYRLIDCQVYTPHLVSLGAETIDRLTFQRLLGRFSQDAPADGAWVCP